MVVDSGSIQIDIKLLTQGINYGLSKAQIYSVPGGSLALQYGDTLNPDSLIHLYAGPFLARDTIFLRVQTTSNTCTTCIASYPTADIIFKNITTHCTAGTPCVLVKNGGFESKDPSQNQCGIDIGTVVDCWLPYQHTTDFYTRGCTSYSGAFNLGTNTCSITGKQVIEKQYHNSNTKEIDVPAGSGIYLLELSDPEMKSIYRQKIVIQK